MLQSGNSTPTTLHNAGGRRSRCVLWGYSPCSGHPKMQRGWCPKELCHLEAILVLKILKRKWIYSFIQKRFSPEREAEESS